MLSLGHDQTMAPVGDMCIEAVCAKRTIQKAHNAAAREAIFFISRNSSMLMLLASTMMIKC